jgi:dihydrolipoamide dehydrogenase
LDTSQLVVDQRTNILVGATITGPGMQELPHSATIVIARDVTLEHTLEPLWHAVPAFPTFSEVSLHLLEAKGL